MKDLAGEIAVSLGLLVVLFVLFNPWNWLMPGYLVMSLLVGIVVLYAAFAVFLWQENHGDEREELHRMFADRIAYLAGSAVLLLGIVLGEIHNDLNPWLVAALGAMVLAKIVGRIHTKLYL